MRCKHQMLIIFYEETVELNSAPQYKIVKAIYTVAFIQNSISETILNTPNYATPCFCSQCYFLQCQSRIQNEQTIKFDRAKTLNPINEINNYSIVWTITWLTLTDQLFSLILCQDSNQVIITSWFLGLHSIQGNGSVIIKISTI